MFLYVLIALGVLIEGIVCPPLFAVPIIAAIGEASEGVVVGILPALGEAAAAAAPLQYCLVGETLYAAGNAAWLGAAAGGVAGAAANAAITKANMPASESRAIVSSILSESKASVASVASASKASVASVQSVASVTAELTKSEAQALASAESQMGTGVPAAELTDTALDMYTFGTKSKRTEPASVPPSPTASLPPPPGTPIATIPAASIPAGAIPSLPPGVPEYNVRMCQNDVITMNQTGATINFSFWGTNSILVGNIPSTCMVLANYAIGDPTLGPHPVVMGADSLRWDNIPPNAIDQICQNWDIPHPTAIPSSAAASTTPAARKRYSPDSDL